jgi:formiminoglutamate deiminase
MASIHAELALTPDGWQRDVRISVDDGRIGSVSTGVTAEPGDDRCEVLVPGMPNLHSHAFQRVMAGVTEEPGPSVDSFWTWRDAMYRFALAMTPTELEVVATWLYMEMLEAGFTRVGEFHYLHHDGDGTPYGDIAEMATRIAAGADRAGIRLSLLPVFYAHADFGGAPPADEQRRFVCDLDRYAHLLEGSIEAVRGLDGATIGVAPHSLRAVTPSELTALCDLAPVGPVHIHIAEQRREVEGCLGWSGARPVQWLLDQADVDERWCLVHATHMTDDEAERLAETGAVAGLCPITEANLGDGIFNGEPHLRHAGRFGVGTDSNSRIAVADELRQLEYSQRLATGRRNVVTHGGSTGTYLLGAAYFGGQQALGVPADGIATGAPADVVALDPGVFADGEAELIANAWIFGQGVTVDRVWVSGREVVRDGRHVRRDEARRAYRVVLRSLLDTVSQA